MSKKINIGARYKDGKKTGCAWKGCAGKIHPYRFTYPEEGVVTRGTYKGSWNRDNEGIFPVQHRNRISLKANPKIKLTLTKHWFQKHHVIPCAVMKRLPNISANLKLLGWNMNTYSLNGICLPYNYEAMKFYDLQAHRGSHPIYSNYVEAELQELEGKCTKLCKGNKQDELLEEIGEFVVDFFNDIANWDIMIHAESLNHI